VGKFLWRFSGGASDTATDCLQHGSGQLQNLDLGTFAVLGTHRNPASFGKWIGKHFEFLSVQPDTLADTVPEGFYAVTHLSNQIISRKAGHDVSILPRVRERGEADKGYAEKNISLISSIV